MSVKPETSEQTVARYVYGIVPAGTSLDGLDASGMGGAVQLVSRGTVGAVVEPVDPARPFGKRKDLVAHGDVLNAIALKGPVLPMRFGSVVSGADAVVDELLAPQEQHFRAMLDEVADRVQLTVRVRYVLDEVLAEIVRTDPEVAALRRRTAGLPEEVHHAERVRLGELVARAVEARRRDDERLVRDRLAPHAEDHVVKETGGMDGLAELSFVVRRDRQSELEEAAEALAVELEGLARVSLVGPMALYDFMPGH